MTFPAPTDCPGFRCTRRYIAQSVRDLGCDVAGLPQPVSILETMGRSVGWLAAATALAKTSDREAPHLIYLPEHPFDTNRFIADVDRTVRKIGHAIVVVNEGIRTADGKLVYEVATSSQRDACDRPLPGGVANYLAEVVTQNLKIRCRSEKPGLCGRSSMLHLSKQDWRDADLVGRAAVRAAIDGQSDVMVSLLPIAVGGYDLVSRARLGRREGSPDSAGLARCRGPWRQSAFYLLRPSARRRSSCLCPAAVDHGAGRVC